MAGIPENNILRLSFQNHYTALASIPFLAVFFMILLYWFNFDEGMLIAFTVGFLLNAVPTLYLHIEYWLTNKGEEYEVNVNELVRVKKGKVEGYKVGDIDYIQVYLSPAMYKGSNLHFLGIEGCHFARVYLKSDKELVITCLLTPSVEQSVRRLRGVKIVRKKRLFNTIHWK